MTDKHHDHHATDDTAAKPAPTAGQTPVSDDHTPDADRQGKEGTHGRPTDDADPGHS